MKCAIYGAGSLGTVLGAYMTKNGQEVELINRNKAHVEALNQKGAHIKGTVDFKTPVKAITPDQMTGKYDVFFLMTKQLFNKAVVTFLKDYLTEDGVIVTLQNGIPEPGIAEIVGKNHTMGCTVEFEENLIGARWSKLLINATFSGLGTVIGGVFGDVSEGKDTKKIALACMKECIDVGTAAGVTFAPVQGKDITKLFYYKNALKQAFGILLLPIAMKKHRDIEPSMLQDLKHGKACEIDAINGVVCEWGKKCGVSTPINDKIVEVIKKEQAGELKLTHDNIKFFKNLV